MLTPHPFPVRIDINNQPSPQLFLLALGMRVGEVLVNLSHWKLKHRFGNGGDFQAN